MLSREGLRSKEKPTAREEIVVSAEDKARNTAENTKGKAKEAAGRVTGRRDLEERGRADQAKSDVKQAGEKVKDATNR